MGRTNLTTHGTGGGAHGSQAASRAHVEKQGGFRLAVYSDASHLGGAEGSLRNLLGALAPEIEVHVLATNADVAEHLASGRPGAARRVVAPVRGKFDVRSMLALRRAIAEIDPDVFHANLNSIHSCQYALAAAETIRGVAVVAVEHSLVGPDTKMSWALKRWTSRRLAAHVAVGGEAAREIERRAHLPEGSVTTIHNGVPDRDLAPLPRVTAAPCVGTIARLDPIKGLDMAVDALALLPDVHLVVVGEGSERDALERRAEGAGVAGRVHLVGGRDDARDWLTGFDVFVLPSRSEGLPLTVLEAMLAQRPVVATDVGSVSEAVEDGVTGVLVSAGDTRAFVGAVRSLLDDPERRLVMGQAGRDRALHLFGVEAMAHAYEDVYAGTLAGAHA